jgi:hypothetical protein
MNKMELVAIDVLISRKLEIPNFQRFKDADKIAAIVAYQSQYFAENGGQFNFYGAICVNVYSETGYILDGQHRYYAALELYKLHGQFKLNVQTQRVESLEEMYKNFKVINLNTLMPDIPPESRDVCEEVFYHYKHRFGAMLSPLPNCRRPKLWEKKFIEFIGSIFSLNPFVTAGEIIETIDAINVAENIEGSYAVGTIKKAKEAGCYLGFISLSPPMGVKTKIPSTLRLLVWQKRFNTFDGECICCARSLRYEEFHCGHVVAEAKGGKCQLDNLEPICAQCNTSMGTQNLYTFKEKHFSQ